MADKKLKIIITGDNGESLPPPYGGIIKRCLMHAKEWKEKEAEVYLQIYHKHDNENDLGAGANYFYDFNTTPSFADKLIFAGKGFLTSPRLFIKLLFKQIILSPKFYFKTFIYCAARGVALAKAAKLINPDIFITETGGWQSLMSLEVARLKKIPIILINSAEIFYKVGKDGVNIAETYSRLWKELVNGVDLVISTSRHCAQGPEKYLVPSAKLKIIYSGIDFEKFNRYAGEKKETARQKLDLLIGDFIVLSVGALSGRKGHDQLLEALLTLPPEQINKITVVLCGMGDSEKMRQVVTEIGFPLERVKIFQNLPDEELAQLYSAVDCFCFPSVTPRECMGLALKEAMSAGLPVAAYASGGIPEAIEPGTNGFLAPVNDRQALAWAVVSIQRLSPEERARMGQANIVKAKQLFDIKKTAGQIYQYCLQLKLEEKI